MNDCDRRVKILFSMLVYEVEKELRRIKKYIQPAKYIRYYDLLGRYKKGANGSGRSSKG